MEDAILNIDNISHELSEIQTIAVSIFKQVREDIERRTDLEVKEFSVDIHQLMFNGIPTIRLSTGAKELVYMADQSILDMDLNSPTFEENKKHTIVQDYSKSVETALQVPGTPVPQLPTLRELPSGEEATTTTMEATKRLKKKSTASGEEEQQSPAFPVSQKDNSIQEQEAVYGSNLLTQLLEEEGKQSAFDDVMHPTSEQEQQPLHVSGTQLSEEEGKPPAFAEEEGPAVAGKLVILPSSNTKENIVSGGDSYDEEEWDEIVGVQTSSPSVRRSKRLSNAADDDVEVSEEAMRNFTEQPFNSSTLLNTDMSLEEAVDLVKKSVVESIVAVAVYEQKGSNALHDLIKFVLLKQAKDAWKKKDFRLNLAGIMIEICKYLLLV